MSVNKAILIGRLGRDPELRATRGGKSVCSFSIATESAWKDDKGEKQTRTEWHQISVWGAQAEACERYLAKGREVFVEGEIRSSKYQARDGTEKTAVEIVARDVRFIGNSGGNNKPVAAKEGSSDDPFDF